MDFEHLQDKITRMCSGLVTRVEEQTRNFDRWPEEFSQLNQLVSLVNEMGRKVRALQHTTAVKQNRVRRNRTQKILAQAFEDVLSGVSIEDAPEPVPTLPPFTFDGRIFKVGEILQFLADCSRSGQVRVQGGRESFVLNLDRGQLTSAYSTNSPDGFKLGEILVRQFGVNEDVLNRFIADLVQDGTPLGKALSDHSVVPQAVVYEALHYQMVSLFERCVAQEGADIVYEASKIESLADGPSLNVADILLTAAIPKTSL